MVEKAVTWSTQRNTEDGTDGVNTTLEQMLLTDLFLAGKTDRT